MRYSCMTTQTTPAQAPQPPAAKTTPRVPPPAAGININHCKNPTCTNFGVPIPEVAQKGPGAVNTYTIVAVGAKAPAARCNACGEVFTLKSNRGVFEETYRILEQTYPSASCPDTMCDNHRVPVHIRGGYCKIGETKLGSNRYLCKCGKSFSVKPKGINPISRQIQSDKNRTILAMLTNMVPLRRICEVADVHPEVLRQGHLRVVAVPTSFQQFPDVFVFQAVVKVDKYLNRIHCCHGAPPLFVCFVGKTNLQEVGERRHVGRRKIPYALLA